MIRKLLDKVINLCVMLNNCRRWFLDVVLHGRTRSKLAQVDAVKAKRLKVALVCIAKNEDDYIDEWIQYHLRLGFDEVFVYQNNWRYSGSDKHGDNVHWLNADGERQQLNSYNSFIANYGKSFDFAAFIDVDEFICLVKDGNVKEFLTQYLEFGAVALNWRYFGDNGLSEVVAGDHSVVKRFTRCGRTLNKHIKTIVNLSKSRANASFCSPHHLTEAVASDNTIAVDGKSFVHGPFLYRHDYSIAWLNHYYAKTKQEFLLHKRCLGRADLPLSDCHQVRDMRDFDAYNQNDVENFLALQHMND